MSEKTYKVWVELEAIDNDDEDETHEVPLPFACTREFDNEEDACMFASALHEWGQKECD